MFYKDLELDQFQVDAITAINNQHSVIVTAPTGAGKTVIAEYAVEKCLQTNKRVIYTAPIKALSNQKYRDFQSEYGDKIGIVTGDVVLNPYAQVLLMTTEIFRNTIFDDIDRLNDVSYVIFDEIHYINDIERGTVWEESIIFAPQHIKFVCLSATIPNIKSFAEWMQNVRDIEIQVVEELKRPVPLEHHFYFTDWGIGKLKHLAAYNNIGKRNRRYDDWYDEPLVPSGIIETELIPYLNKEKRLPCLYFCFSRKACEANAFYYSNFKSYQFLDKVDQEQILDTFDALCEQFDITEESVLIDFRELIACGIAYHHAGMLPTLKEVVERLFTSGLIQLLYTTETFAVGINMPACTVVFDSLEKYDGINFRYLKTREYHQMAGRAGRRGIDKIGYVYAKVNPNYATYSEVKRVVSKNIEPITSQFNLSYSSILNLYKKYGENIYDVYKMSLSNHQNTKIIDDLNKEISDINKKRDTLPTPDCIHENIDGLKQIRSYDLLEHTTKKDVGKLYSEISEIKDIFSGKKGDKKQRERALTSAHNKINKVRSQLSNNLCHECHKRKQCTDRYKSIRKQEQRINHIKGKQRSIEGYHHNQIKTRINVLKTLGYIESEELLPRGHTASHIYGYELQITELLFKGFFERLKEDEINCLMVAIVTEPRKDGYYRKVKDKNILEILGTAWIEINNIKALEQQLKVSEEVPMMEQRLCSAMLAWSRGCEFDKLTNYADLDPGDFVRTFRLVIDQLRQIRRAMKGHTALTDKLNWCIGKINRDVVDAERQLRIGEEKPSEKEDKTQITDQTNNSQD